MLKPKHLGHKPKHLGQVQYEAKILRPKYLGQNTQVNFNNLKYEAKILNRSTGQFTDFEQQYYGF